MRRSGILLHITSLPGGDSSASSAGTGAVDLGVGDLGAGAHAFADFLAAAGQRVWQVLPLTITDAATGNSPFSSLSAFALDPLLLSLDELAPSSVAKAVTAERVDYDAVRRWKMPRLDALLPTGDDLDPRTRQQFDVFCRRQAGWLEEFALFAALRHRFDQRSWVEWPEDLRDRRPRALRQAREDLSEETSRIQRQQFFLDRQWLALRRHAGGLGIEMLGDLPFYVSHDSADVWCHRSFFALDRIGRCASVAGVPPDHFSADGQLWGHPVYDWDALAADGYSWWVARLRRQLELFDLVRVDHFRGFAAFWQVPASAETAAGGEWVAGPGTDLFHHLRQELGKLPLVAEDLGTITADVRDLIRELDLPGMRVLQFAFHEDDDENPHRPSNHPHRTIAYTGTHDNNTLHGWLEEEADAEELARIDRYLGREAEAGSRAGERPDELVSRLLASPAELAILPLQDVLGLGGEARMNRPAQPFGNWEWRVRQDQLTPEAASRLRHWTEQADRLENRS